MALRTFDFGDVTVPHDALRALPDTAAVRERIWARAERGPAPPCAAALLAERGDDRGRRMLEGLAGYLDAPDVPALAALGSVDALAVALAAPGVPLPTRAAAAEALAVLSPTAVSLAVLGEVAAEPANKPPRPQALSALDAQLLRADEPLRAAADKLRGRIKLVRTWTGVRRQELQRDVATGALHPVAGLFAGDPTFLATLVPPIADGARAGLMPALLANARDAAGPARDKTFELFHGRWRDVAREPLSALARFVKLRGRDAELPSLAVSALARMGAHLDLVYAAVCAGPEARAIALTALERVGAAGLGEPEKAALLDAVAQLEHGGDAGVAERLRKLLEG